jgi:hypothetical protein
MLSALLHVSAQCGGESAKIQRPHADRSGMSLSAFIGGPAVQYGVAWWGIESHVYLTALT